MLASPAVSSVGAHSKGWTYQARSRVREGLLGDMLPAYPALPVTAEVEPDGGRLLLLAAKNGYPFALYANREHLVRGA
ncbi:hypothetical protein DES52_12324 [Deinococcus yavapaiensis KR-236]|uniref:Uncharacterized protein n=1 Tax=Deinococcus yavapaiensis KR-236 TaxID=694435 RepID=A0A318SCK6_9DEIO|nr:hypothetical protein DES52_12324 [Deinococcus yavapaiensis KR-236]